MSMTVNEEIRQLDLGELKLIYYPDPRLNQRCRPIEAPTDSGVADLVARMSEIMLASRGVGLAAPQVGVTARMFLASPTCQADDIHVYINPRIVSVDGNQDGEEGCLSFPGIFCKVKRHNQVVIEADDLTGRRFQETGEGLLARIFEHESDHLEGTRLVDRMGSVARMAHRKALRELESQFVPA
jgi:peptide deformylase